MGFFDLINNFFKNTVGKITGLGIFKFIGFVSFVGISSFMSVIMYLIMGQDLTKDIGMVAWGVGTESFKVVSAITTTANFALLAFYFAKARNLKQRRENVESWTEYFKPVKQTKKYFLYRNKYKEYILPIIVSFAIYCFCVASSMFASIGFGIETAYQYNKTSQLVDNSSPIALEGKKIIAADKAILGKKEIQKQNDEIVKIAFGDLAALDNTDVNYVKKQGVLKAEITKYQKANLALNIEITAEETKKLNSESEISRLSIDQEAQNTVKDLTMFDLMGQEFNRSPSDMIFVLVMLLASVTEIGIFSLAPHKTDITDEVELEEEKDFEKKKTKTKPNIVVKRKTEEIVKKNKEIEIPANKPIEELAAEEVSIVPEIIEEPVVVPKKIIEPVVIPKKIIEAVSKKIEEPVKKPSTIKLDDKNLDAVTIAKNSITKNNLALPPAVFESKKKEVEREIIKVASGLSEEQLKAKAVEIAKKVFVYEEEKEETHVKPESRDKLLKMAEEV